MSVVSQLYNEVMGGFKNTYGRFWSSTPGRLEYYLKLEGHYFCKKQRCTMIVLQVRHKRTVERVPVKSVVADKSLVKALHPADACIIGILANHERNGQVDTTCDGWQKMKRFRHVDCFVKSEPLLQIARKHFNDDGHEITVLYSPCLDKEISLSTVALSKNQALLYALDSFQAFSVGYDASESCLRQQSAMR